MTEHDTTRVSCDARDGQLDSEDITSILEDMHINASIYFAAAFDSCLADSVAKIPKPERVGDIAERVAKVRTADGSSMLQIGHTPQSLVEEIYDAEFLNGMPRDPDGYGRAGGFVHKKTGSPPSAEAMAFLAMASGVVEVSDDRLVNEARDLVTTAAKWAYKGFVDERGDSFESEFVEATVMSVLSRDKNDLFGAIDEHVEVPGSAAPALTYDVLCEDIKDEKMQTAILAAVKGDTAYARKAVGEFIANCRQEYAQTSAETYIDNVAQEGIPLQDVRFYKGENWEPQQQSIGIAP